MISQIVNLTHNIKEAKCPFPPCPMLLLQGMYFCKSIICFWGGTKLILNLFKPSSKGDSDPSLPETVFFNAFPKAIKGPRRIQFYWCPFISSQWMNSLRAYFLLIFLISIKNFKFVVIIVLDFRGDN